MNSFLRDTLSHPLHGIKKQDNNMKRQAAAATHENRKQQHCHTHTHRHHHVKSCIIRSRWQGRRPVLPMAIARNSPTTPQRVTSTAMAQLHSRLPAAIHTHTAQPPSDSLSIPCQGGWGHGGRAAAHSAAHNAPSSQAVLDVVGRRVGAARRRAQVVRREGAVKPCSGDGVMGGCRLMHGIHGAGCACIQHGTRREGSEQQG